MFKIFSGAEKSPSSPNRSRTLAHLHSSDHDAVATSASTTTVNGLQFDFILPSLVPIQSSRQNEAAIGPTGPTKSHQRTLTEVSRSTQNLPPLITRPSESRPAPPSNISGITPFNPATPFDEFQVSLEQSRQSLPTRSNQPSLFTRDNTAQGKAQEKVEKLADWFKGESRPISIGITPSAIKEKADPLDIPAVCSDLRPTSLIQRRLTTQSLSKSAMASRFSFFNSKASLAKPTPQSIDVHDDLLDGDLTTALFPNGPADPSSSAAFKDLQQQAETLLLRLQTAYRERTMSLHEMSSEKAAVAEEAEGAETRARYLKIQLDDMSVKLAEQDEAMMNLVDELAQGKLARREEEEARKRTIRLVDHHQTPRAGRKRTSCSSTVSDSGFESEDDISAESVFSRRNGAHSPTMSMSSVSTTSSPETYHTIDLQLPRSTPQAARLRVPSSQTIVKGQPPFYQHNIPEGIAQSSCPNCEGVRASEAWSVVSVLKEENTGLKHRVGDLEGALDGCLDVVGRLS
jgi:hypothetical protein